MERADHPATAGRVLALGTPFLDPASQAPEAAPPPEPDRAYKALVHVPALLEASPGKGGRVALRTLLGGETRLPPLDPLGPGQGQEAPVQGLPPATRAGLLAPHR